MMPERPVDGFDGEAARYEAIRPVPPEALIDRLLEKGRLGPGSRVLEVGCGSGQATRLLAPHGLRLYAIDIGPRLLALARTRLAPWPEVSFEQIAFEAFASPEPFEAIVSVQAFHWIDPAIGLEKAARLLAPGGSLLLAWHLCASQTTGFYQATQPVYDRYQGNITGPDAVSAPARFTAEISASPHFNDLSEDSFDWSLAYTRPEYLDLLRTFSDVQAMAQTPREAFLAEIGALIDNFGGSIVRHYRSRLLTACRC